ncbi:hypothetical protein [Caulobacter mirabilis]|uniref:Uncharacterized protein n=1 Tax=Caulobacter mirabilis TaxID=69666 RepID=A0A2D2B2B1_9CAUL|nr:hypothetical protein [Caulobacter mirabilis]ATQ44403.1 hypothetical protein CSW64_19445 [Caulobacter mirabilis]
MGGRVHYELFVRRRPGSGWTLDIATEDRARVIEAAEDALAEGRVAAVRVTKEILNEETMEFSSVTILERGAPDRSKPRKERDDSEPLCVSPGDLYTCHARERIGRLLDGWLTRQKATPFELLHRPDLVQKLEAEGVELQHAIQKIAVPEAQARGIGVHEIMRSFQRLAERAIERLLKDARKGNLPDIDKEGFAKAAERLVKEPERSYLLGAGVAASIAPARGWGDKVGLLLDLADSAPLNPEARDVALAVIEQPLTEILGSRAGMMDLLGVELDLGGQLAAMTRLAGADSVEALIGIEASVARVMPALEPPAARLANWLAGPHFEACRSAIAQRVLRELTGPRRLKPGEAEAEIELLRGLAMALTAAGGRVLSMEDIHHAFTERSKALVTGDFVDALLGMNRSSREEIEILIKLAENVTGGANKRQAARWLNANVSSLRFEKEQRYGPDSPVAKLVALAALQKSVLRAGLAPEDADPIRGKIGEVAGMVEADGKLVAALAKASAPAVHRLNLLLRMAVGETAPLGPAADRARSEALKLVKAPGIREELTRSPEALAQMRGLMQTAGLAA